MPDIARFYLTRPHLELYKRKAMWGQDGFVSIIYDHKGIAKVSLGYRFGTKGHNQWDKVRLRMLCPDVLCSAVCTQA